MNQQEILDARYGRTKRSRRREFIFGASVAVVATLSFLIWAGFVTQTNATTPSPNTLSYQVVSDQQVSVTYSVSNAGNRAITCDLQALDSKYVIVGEREVDVPAGASQQTSLVNTVSKAVTGVVKACWVK
jgi:hypothetical protein